jgi:iron(III) transport system substrate-binding protein
LLSVGAATLWRSAQAGLLQPAAPAEALQSVPQAFRGPDGLWVGIAYWARVIAYLKDRWQAADLADYEALADPKFRQQILVRSATSPYNRGLVAALIDADGVEAAETWARGLVANLARPPQGGDTSQLQAMAAGEGSIAIVNTRYWARLATSEKVTEQELVANVGVVFPNQANRGSEVDIIGAALLKRSPHPEAAGKLLLYLLQPDVQEKFAAANLDYPVRPNVPAQAALRELGPFKIDGPAVAKLGKFQPEADEVMAKAGWE